MVTPGSTGASPETGATRTRPGHPFWEPPEVGGGQYSDPPGGVNACAE
jgi:hypothetical protein